MCVYTWALIGENNTFYIVVCLCMCVCVRLWETSGIIIFGKCDQPHSYITLTSLTALPSLFVEILESFVYMLTLTSCVLNNLWYFWAADGTAMYKPTDPAQGPPVAMGNQIFCGLQCEFEELKYYKFNSVYIALFRYLHYLASQYIHNFNLRLWWVGVGVGVA